MPLIDILSVDRFATYLQWAGNDSALAERLYSYNVQLSADFYSSLHMLEIALRNSTDSSLINAYGRDWLDNSKILTESYQHQCVQEARKSLIKENREGSHSQMVAELNFGFWSSLYGKKSHHLWGKLRPIFNTQGLQRTLIAQKLRDLRRLRNRIAHYEPILAQPIVHLHEDILKLTAWMSVDAAAWITCHSNIVYPATPIIVTDPDSGKSVFDMALCGHLPA
jgi:hypothetical protein